MIILIMNKLIILSLIIFSTLISNSEASLAAEPHNDEHLRQYAKNPAFDASVAINNCSASRIQIDADDPVDFYITAAHCLHDKSSIRSQIDTSIIKALEEIIHLEDASSHNRIPACIIFEKHLAKFNDHDVRTANVSATTKASLIQNCIRFLMRASPQAFLSELNPIDPTFINVREIDFIKHPDPSKDLAIFTTGKKTNKPRYALYNGHPKNALGKTVINVAFGDSLLAKTSTKPAERQAFNSIIERLERNNTLVSIPFQPDLNRTLNDSPIGVVTKGDSGGTLLIKENNTYKLIGVCNGTHTGDVQLGYYQNIPNSLKSNSHNQMCLQQLKTGGQQCHCCYGTRTIWAGIDLNFIANAKKILLARMHGSQSSVPK